MPPAFSAAAWRFVKTSARTAAGTLLRGRVIKKYLKTHQVRGLHIGAGTHILSGWLNTNYPKFSGGSVLLDASRPFPFDDALFDLVFSEHQIEHLSYQEGKAMLGECFRVMKPGGILRLATPDLDRLTGLFARQKTPEQQQYITWMVGRYYPDSDLCNECLAINNAFRNWGHQFLYDFGTIRDSLLRAGFSDVRQCAPGVSRVRGLQGIDRHGATIGSDEVNAFETLVVEAQRPG
ncbi:MAG: class I SAM-dependent methyltransferase [Thermodesulfovibrionales bacterium]